MNIFYMFFFCPYARISPEYNIVLCSIGISLEHRANSKGVSELLLLFSTFVFYSMLIDFTSLVSLNFL